MKHTLFAMALMAPAMAMAQHPNPEMSILEIYDVETKTHQVIKEFPDVIEAPNWSPDGKWLLLNKNGKLYKLAAGIPYIIYANDKKEQSPAQIKALAKLLNAIGDKCKAAGLKLGFHHDMQIM